MKIGAQATVSDNPPEIGELNSLELLTLEDNELGNLPEKLGSLPRLAHLTLHGNEALGVPLEVVGPSYFESMLIKNPLANPHNILDYYFARQTQPSRALNEVKLLRVSGEARGRSISKRSVTEEQRSQMLKDQVDLYNKLWPSPLT